MDEPVSSTLSTLLIAIGIFVVSALCILLGLRNRDDGVEPLSPYSTSSRKATPARVKPTDSCKRPDRLLGVVLIGNILVNSLGATAAALVGFELFGETGLAAAPFVITLVVPDLFAEVAPKTVAAHQSRSGLRFPAAYILSPMLKLLYPFVVLVNAMSNFILRPFLRMH